MIRDRMMDGKISWYLRDGLIITMRPSLIRLPRDGMPAGRPRPVRRRHSCPFRRRVWRLMSTVSRMRTRRIRHSTPDTAWAMMVAQATPATPMPRSRTKYRSSTMFIRLAITR